MIITFIIRRNGKRVKQYKELKNLSQEELAFRLNSTQTTISNKEPDKNIPNSVLINKISKKQGVEIKDKLDDKNSSINLIEKK